MPALISERWKAKHGKEFLLKLSLADGHMHSHIHSLSHGACQRAVNYVAQGAPRHIAFPDEPLHSDGTRLRLLQLEMHLDTIAGTMELVHGYCKYIDSITCYLQNSFSLRKRNPM